MDTDEMLCEHECHMVGGPWVAENPSCPLHGLQARQTREDRSSQIHDVLVRVWYREISADEGMEEIESLIEVY